MFNDETQVDDLENTSEEEVEESEAEPEEEAEEEPTKDWEAEAKKWEAIAKRKAKQSATKEVKADTPVSLDQELIDLTYRNYLGSIGLTSKSVQDEAIATAKKLGMQVAGIQNDEALMAVFRQKQEIAKTNNAIAKGTGGAAIRKKDVDYYVSQMKSGKSLPEDISGDMAVKILKSLK